MSEVSTKATKKISQQEEVVADSAAETESGSRNEYFRILVPYLIIILAQLPLFSLYFKNLWETRPHYQLCLLAPVALGLFLYFWWPRTLKRPFCRSWFSVVLMVVGVFFAFLATIFVTPWFAAFSTICLLGSLLARTRNEETGRTLLPLTLLLLVFLQPPSGFDFDTVHGDRYIVTQLQTVSSSVSSYFLDLLGYKHNLQGATIQMPDPSAEHGFRAYSVEAACSGIQSFFTLLFFTAIFIIVFKRPWFRGTLLVLSAMFWAVIMNTIRILVIPIADIVLDMDLSVGFAHMMWGYIALGIGVLLVISTDQFFVFLFGPVDADAIDEESSLRKKFSQFWNSVFSGKDESERTRRKNRPISPVFKKALWPVAGVMGLMALVQVVDVFNTIRQNRYGVRFFDYDPTMALIDEDAPVEIGTVNNLWTKTDYTFEDRVRSSDLGQRSDMWVYRATKGENTQAGYDVRASFDQTFPGWHELTTCYKLEGWRMASEGSRIKVNQTISEDGREWPLIQAEFVNSSGEYGFLLFSIIDRVGEPYDAPGNWGSINSTLLRIRNRLSHRIRARLVNGEGYQIQIFVPSNGQLPLSIKEDLIENYLIFREHFRMQFEDGSIKLVSETPDVQQTEDGKSFDVDDANPAAF